MKPLISCIMPTMLGRTVYRREAVACYESQTWPNKELVIVWDEGTVGAKRNMACSRAHGEFIAHWDDDDWYHPERLERQMALLERENVELVGFHRMEFFDDNGGRWEYVGRDHYILGTSMLYTKDCWRRRPFDPGLQWGEDNAFQEGRKMAWEAAGELMRARIHPGNTSEKASKLDRREYRPL